MDMGEGKSVCVLRSVSTRINVPSPSLLARLVTNQEERSRLLDETLSCKIW